MHLFPTHLLALNIIFNVETITIFTFRVLVNNIIMRVYVMNSTREFLSLADKLGIYIENT